MKKVLVLLFMIFGFAFMFEVSANAHVTSYEEAVSVVEKANLTIDAEIEKALEKEASLSHDSEYDTELDKIISKLVIETNKIADKTIVELEKGGFIVECEIQTISIGNRVVEIDPLRLHDW